jgi:hypothetical protein
MSMFIGQSVQSPAPLLRHPLAPYWLTHLGALGIFSVSVIDSSVIPLPLPGSTDLLLLWLVAHGGDPWLLAPCALAGSVLGGYTTWHIGRRGGEDALRGFLNALSDGLSVIPSWRSLFLLCFLRRFRSCLLHLPPERWEFRAGAFSPSSERRAACVTLSLPGSAWSTVAVLCACGRAAWKGGPLRCFAASWACWWPASAWGYGRSAACARLMPRRNSRDLRDLRVPNESVRNESYNVLHKIRTNLFGIVITHSTGNNLAGEVIPGQWRVR